MKTVIVGPAYPLRGGIADFNEALCKAFIQQHIDCSIVSFYYQYPSFLFPGKTQKSGGEKPHGLIINSLISSVNPLSWFEAAKKIKAEKPDFVIIRYWLPFMAPALGTIAKQVKKNSRIKVIAIMDNVIPHEKRPGDKMLTRYFVSRCDAFVVMAKSLLEDLKEFTSATHTLFTPHPVYDIFGEKVSKQEARKHLSLDEHDKYILFFGFIRAYKGLDLLIKAIGDERIKTLKIKLIVAGEFYGNEKVYMDLINEYELKDHVILHTHYIPKEEVKHYFCAADLVVQPYHTATQSGITQIAYHFERPMIVTNVGGLAEIVPDNRTGYVVERSPDAIADAITRFFQKNKEAEFSANAAKEKEKFSWQTLVNGILHLYERLSSG